jgi:ribosome maturation factor RimP
VLAVDKTATISHIERLLAENLPDVDLVDVEVADIQGNFVLRVFIDHPEGVDHDLCVKVTGLLDCYQEDHTVEVSSPGIERRLRKPEHFQAAVGKKINVKTFGPVEGGRNFTGFLISTDGDSLIMQMEERVISLSLDNVGKAKTVFEFEDEPEDRLRAGKKRSKKRK